MLRQYGPNVPEPILQKLVAAFGELRNLADQGIINYPYSTREVVNIVKHLQVWHLPVRKSLKEVISLVLDFFFFFFLPNLYQVFPFLFNTDSGDIVWNVCNPNEHLLFNLWIDFDKVLCHGYYQGARKFGGGFLRGVGRQESETEGKLYYYLTLYNKHI